MNTTIKRTQSIENACKRIVIIGKNILAPILTGLLLVVIFMPSTSYAQDLSVADAQHAPTTNITLEADPTPNVDQVPNVEHAQTADIAHTDATEMINEGATPLTYSDRYWSPLNFIFAGLATLFGLAVTGVKFLAPCSRSDRQSSVVDENEGEFESVYPNRYSAKTDSDELKDMQAIKDRKAQRLGKIWALAGSGVAVLMLHVCLFTQNTSLPMALVDKWTLLMVVLLLVEVMFIALAFIRAHGFVNFGSCEATAKRLGFSNRHNNSVGLDDANTQNNARSNDDVPLNKETRKTVRM